MLLPSLVAALLGCAPAAAAPLEPAAPVLGDHGKIAWFSGTFEEALAKAKAENKLVFVDFWTSWCGWCKRLDKDTFSNDAVVADMKELVCLSIDAESETGAPIAKRFKVRGYPALLVLAPDGTAEDNIGGYLPPDKFRKAIQRVRAGEGTVSGLKKKVAAEPTNPGPRLELANKLGELGDDAGRAAQIAEIKKIDPEGKSLPMRRIALDEVRETINAGFQKTQTVDTAPMAAFLAQEKHPELLFEGWASMGQMSAFLAHRAQQAGDQAAADKHQVEHRDALRKAWSHVPAEQVGPFGNSLAWAYYEGREKLTDADKAFALEVAEKAQGAAKDDPNVLDTYACCLAMNGRKDEAIRQIQRCIELEPDKQQWKDRLAELQG